MEPDVLLIVCDSLRKDIMQIYGGEARTPNLLKLKEDAVVYENAIAPSPWTFPSHVSLFTGLYLNEHKVHETEKDKLLDLTKFNLDLKAERLAEYFSNRGYNTLGISNNPMVSVQTAFDIGFQNFFMIDPFPVSKEDPIFQEARRLGASPKEIAFKLIKQGKFGKIIEFAKLRKREKLISEVINFPLDKGAELTNKMLLNGNWESKFFRFINFLEVHEPYRNYNSKEVWNNVTGIKPISQNSIKNVRKEYLAEMEYLDEQIGKLISTLKKVGKYDNTMIIITSDHGQAINEHGYMLHSTYLYDELVRIPLIIKYPNSKKFETKKGYQNLVYLPKLIKDILEGGDDSSVYSETTFSEAYGAVIVLPGGYKDREEYVKKTYEKLRKAVYKENYKLTVNGTDGTIEDFLKDGKEISVEENREKAKELLEEIEIFKGKEEFIIPKIN